MYVHNQLSPFLCVIVLHSVCNDMLYFDYFQVLSDYLSVSVCLQVILLSQTNTDDEMNDYIITTSHELYVCPCI